MPNYNFIDLSPVDFEELSRDLLQKHYGVFLESFKEGPDQGIDLRYSNDNENTLIVQCKRYSSIANLKKNLKNEVKKVRKLSPKRYVIVTSVNLTTKKKNDIKTIFKDVRLFLKDIFGQKDINNLLGKYPDVEKNHYKLWLNSTNVLEKIIHTSIYNRSDFEREEIEREIKIFVTNDSNKEASEILNQNNYVIISGIPGIGKTTLARMLLYTFLLDDWELIPLSADIKEAEDVYQKGKAQVFYYDDFLGTNFLAALIPKNEDKRIIKFIERIKKSSDKKLILTTREYILNQAIHNYEALQDKSVEVGKCTIDLKKYNKLIKGKILYNHLFYSGLDYFFFQDLLNENRFLRIINHQNYNPRIIQYLTDKKFLGDLSSNSYYNFFMENLANPQHIWNYAFTSHISSISRYLLIVFLSLGEPIFKEDLYVALSSFFEKNEKQYGIKLNEIEYDRALKECERTFIIIDKTYNNKILIKFQNPSIEDFLLNYLNNYHELVKHLINASIFFNQFFEIYSTRKYRQTVNLDETLQRLLFVKIKKVFYSIPVSTLIQRFDIKDYKYYWTRDKYEKIERLKILSRFYDLSVSKNVLDFLYDEFNQIELEKEIFSSDELNSYLTLVDMINEQIKIDGENIIDKIFTKEKIENFEDIKEAIRLKDIFPDKYTAIAQSLDNKIAVTIKNAISNEYSYLENYLTKDKIEEFIDELSILENDFNLELANYREKAVGLMSELEEEKEEEKKETKSIPTLQEKIIADDEVLINIFQTLKTGE
ncbi:MAG: restriction endonuclease [Ignavibacteriaceae bacterium]|jgi:hypothetical protein